MSQFNPPERTDFDMHAPPRSGTNVLGIVGFILALLCVTAPLGLLVSLIALTKRPRGLAIAGVIIGLLFTALLAFVVFVIWPVMEKAFHGVTDFENIKSAAITYQGANAGQMPPDLATLALPVDVTTDPWGQPWGYERSADGTSYTLITLGPDGVAGTSDDRRLAWDLQPNDVGQELGQAIGDYFKDQSKQPAPAPATPTPATPAPATP